ncbi:nuclear transport factor 2 family protein [Novosphingobium colocasiae]
MARAAAKLVLRRFYRAIVQRDMAALSDTLTEDAIYEFPLSETGSSDPADCRRYIGRDAVVAFWQATSAIDMLFAAPEDVTCSILADGSRLFFLEQRGNITLPSGFAYRNRYIFRYDFRDGQIALVREYLNPVISAIAFGRPLPVEQLTR